MSPGRHTPRIFLATLAALCFAGGLLPGATPWGRDYFPNVTLTTQDGKQVRFFDDLIEGKIVVINFIYTSCPDTCPLETAQLVKVQNILGERLGTDVFFYSISLDPTRDTPEVLKEYSKTFQARWTFLTGEVEDVWNLQKKLGLFLDEIRDGLNNHNVNMIIGNQATGRWMKRSPHENPYVLADQIGNWLDGWKRPPELDDYANAPKLRDLSRGEQLFRTRCSSCHSVTGEESAQALGPDLLGVTHRREPQWLFDWLKAPDQMLAKKDPIAMALFERYRKLPMPNLRLNQEEAQDLLDYLEQETRRKLNPAAETPRPVAANIPARASAIPPKRSLPESASPTSPREKEAEESTSSIEVVTVSQAWIREAHPASRLNTGFLTIVNPGSEDVTLTRVQSGAFQSVEIQEMTKVEGRMKRQLRTELLIPAGGEVELKPGGLHLLMKGRQLELPEGDEVELTLTFGSGLRQTTTVRVAAH